MQSMAFIETLTLQVKKLLNSERFPSSSSVVLVSTI